MRSSSPNSDIFSDQNLFKTIQYPSYKKLCDRRINPAIKPKNSIKRSSVKTENKANLTEQSTMLGQKFDTLPDLSKSAVVTKKVADRKTKKRNISPPPLEITNNSLCLKTAQSLYEKQKPIRGQHNMSPARLKALNDLKKQSKSNKPV